ncbi:MAG TPA: HupE/UreJ family protein [Kofleriaceae bacterium]|nr:HupE/UreJ family protein [Kofleriaceae bacterium]
MNRARPVVVFGLGLVAMCALAAPAAAHQSSVTYLEATLDGPRVRVSVRLAPRDLAEDLGGGDLPVEAAALIATHRDDIARHVIAGVEIQDGETPCPPSDVTVAPSADRIEVGFVALCPAPPAHLVLDYALVFAADRNHTAALRVHVPGQPPADTLLAVDSNRFSWRLSEPPPSGAVAFIRQGIHHVATGLDHIAFVLALLLAIVIARDATGWQVRRLAPALRSTAATVSAFTVAHSLTLIAAALGYVELPARLVESVIAASIVFTAVADILRPEARWRLATAFGFGLMHGLGFARMLAELLPPGDIIVPLLCFNLGVEIAQLAVVVVAVPTAWVLARFIGAPRYRTVALPALAAPLIIFGAIWLIERVSGVTILGI